MLITNTLEIFMLASHLEVSLERQDNKVWNVHHTLEMFVKYITHLCHYAQRRHYKEGIVCPSQLITFIIYITPQ